MPADEGDPALSFDILFEVVGHLQSDTDALKALSTSCHGLLSISQRHIFSQILIPNLRSGTTRNPNPLALHRLFHSSPHIASYVRRVHYNLMLEDFDSDIIPEILLQLPGVEVFNLHLPSSTLNWTNLVAKPIWRDAFLHLIQGANLTRLSFHNITNFPLSTLASPSLTSFEINRSFSDLVDAHAQSCEHLGVKELDVHWPNPHMSVKKWIDAFPNLHSLRISVYGSDQTLAGLGEALLGHSHFNTTLRRLKFTIDIGFAGTRPKPIPEAFRCIASRNVIDTLHLRFIRRPSIPSESLAPLLEADTILSSRANFPRLRVVQAEYFVFENRPLSKNDRIVLKDELRSMFSKLATVSELELRLVVDYTTRVWVPYQVRPATLW